MATSGGGSPARSLSIASGKGISEVLGLDLILGAEPDGMESTLQALGGKSMVWISLRPLCTLPSVHRPLPRGAFGITEIHQHDLSACMT